MPTLEGHKPEDLSKLRLNGTPLTNNIKSGPLLSSSEDKRYPLGDWFNPKSSPYSPEQVGKRIGDNPELFPKATWNTPQSTPETGPIKSGTVYHPQPQWKLDGLPGIPGTVKGTPKQPVSGGGKLRTRWLDEDGNIYDWDSQHGKVEKFDSSGKKHLGEYDPLTGEQTKPPDPSRRTAK